MAGFALAGHRRRLTSRFRCSKILAFSMARTKRRRLDRSRVQVAYAAAGSLQLSATASCCKLSRHLRRCCGGLLSQHDEYWRSHKAGT